MSYLFVLFGSVSRHLGLPDLVLPVGTGGVVSLVGDEMDPRQIISWQLDYSAWNLFALVTCSTLYSPGIGIGGCDINAHVGGAKHVLTTPTFVTDSTPSSLVEDVTAVAKLVIQVLRHNWSLAEYLHPITSQYFTLLQK